MCVNHNEIFKALTMKNILKLDRENDHGYRCRRLLVINCVYQNIQKNKNLVILSISTSKLIKAECHEFQYILQRGLKLFLLHLNDTQK